MKERIIELLKSTNRPGMDGLIAWMEENGFFESPCSGGHHLAKEGGLLEHSINVYDVMKTVSCLYGGATDEEIIICALLHDLGKCGDHGKPGYVPNMIKSRKKDENGEYPMIQSEAKPYEVNKDLYPIDHEIRSIKIASQFIDLTEDEEIAILWHNGLYGNFRYQIQNKETPLYMLLHFADMWASRVIEEVDDNGEV